MERVCILEGLRSFTGVRDGMYKHVPAEKLGAEVLRELVKRCRLEGSEIDLVVGGNAVGGGGNITRLAALEAGISETVPSVTVDLQCGSSLESITMAAAMIESGAAEVVVAGGFESSSTQPLRMWSPNHPDYVENKSYAVAKFIPDIQGEQVMLEGAELTALEEGVKKEEMDAWILRSHKRAALAAEKGILSDMVISVEGSRKDEGIRVGMNQRLIDRLPFILPEGKVITAANACLMNDGAAFVVLCSEKYAGKAGIQPKAYFRKGVSVGGNPMKSPKTAVLAAEKLMRETGLNYRDMDAYEVNEAFAVIDVLFHSRFPGVEDRYNIFGGALAYGHPYGASGAILLIHLIKALERKGGRYGICSVAAAGGIGSAVLIERGDEWNGKERKKRLSGTDQADSP